MFRALPSRLPLPASSDSRFPIVTAITGELRAYPEAGVTWWLAYRPPLMSRCPLTHAVHGWPRRLVVRASRRALLGISAATIAGATTAHAATAQGAILVQGIADAEAWTTDSGSILLTRNGGQPSFLGRMHLWGAAGLGRHVVVYAAGTVETGNARSESGTEWYTELAGVRYTQSNAFVIDAGKIAPVVGTVAARRYSTRNPLIGMPDGYPLQYPLGVQASGARGRFDYR